MANKSISQSEQEIEAATAIGDSLPPSFRFVFSFSLSKLIFSSPRKFTNSLCSISWRLPFSQPWARHFPLESKKLVLRAKIKRRIWHYQGLKKLIIVMMVVSNNKYIVFFVYFYIFSFNEVVNNLLQIALYQ